MDLWRPICLQAKVFSCDEFNWWDIHYASHQQTMALMQTGWSEDVPLNRSVLPSFNQALLLLCGLRFGRFFQSSFDGHTVGDYVHWLCEDLEGLWQLGRTAGQKQFVSCDRFCTTKSLAVRPSWQRGHVSLRDAIFQGRSCHQHHASCCMVRPGEGNIFFAGAGQLKI